MLCARVIRGISSIARNDTPAAANSGRLLHSRQRLAKPHEYLARPEQQQIRTTFIGVGAQAPHLRNNLRFLKELGAAGHPGSGLYVVLVKETSLDAGGIFHNFLDATFCNA